MKRSFALPAILTLVIFCSCQKQQTEEERNAEIERQVQQRLAAERQDQAEQQLAQRQAELDAREKVLAEKQNAAADTPAPQPPKSSIARRMSDTAGNPATASYSTFYMKLEPYGVWRETSNYGYVWQPREAERSRTWRPYTNGRWVYTDAGWTWVSEEPFGWATYHYGRWTRLRNIGWIWVPGDEWAPAWVSWRKSNDYVGWAPLPPEARFDRRSGIHNWADNYYDIGPDQYCFVPTNQFGARRLEATIIPVERNLTIVNQTTNVTNITYSNMTIMNQGPNYDELRARTQQPIERLRLERQITVSMGEENPHPVVRGEIIEMPAPLIARAQPDERPRRVKETIAQTTIDHGWEGIADREAAEKARAKIKSESTPPPNAPPKTLVKSAQAAVETPTPTLTPAFASPTASPTHAPPARPTATAKQMTPAGSPEIPRPSPAVTPTTPVAGVTPTVRASVTPALAPAPLATTPPRPRDTGTMTPRATLTPPRLATPTPSPTPAGAPEISTSSPTAPASSEQRSPSTVPGRSSERKDQRKAERESRQQERGAQEHWKKDELQKPRTRGAETPPGESATATPLTSPSSSGSSSPAEPLKKEEKKKRKRGTEGARETTGTASPSPSTTP
jgi:hypothetical protein